MPPFRFAPSPTFSDSSCRGEKALLFEEQGDDMTLEHYVVELGGHTVRILKQRKDGVCLYLDETKGCTIYDRAPAICREFDCRAYFLTLTRSERRLMEKFAPHKRAVFVEGRKRLNTLTPEHRAAATARRAVEPRCVNGVALYTW